MRTMTDTLPRKDDTRNLLTDIELFKGLTLTQLEWVAQRATAACSKLGVMC